MRILVHDYSGHPFQVELSRELARRGHAVQHVYCRSFQTPRGNLERGSGDAPGFAIRPVSLREEFRKQGLLRRRQQELVIGRLVGEIVWQFHPDVVLSANAPLDAQRMIQAAARRDKARFVFWLQDIYSEAISRLLPKRLPGIGHVGAMVYRGIEARLLRRSDHVVAISRDFLPFVHEHVAAGDVSVVENWAPLSEISPRPRENAWSIQHMPHDGLRVVYSGTLGYKHDPLLLLEVARAIAGHLYVYSEGPGAEHLRQAARQADVANLSVRPWVPFNDLPLMLAGADIALAMIDESAGLYSVPSKVQTYMAAGRPIVASIPRGNLARDLIEREAAGGVADPGDTARFIAQLQDLARDPAARQRAGANGRLYAERAFRIDHIADRFETILSSDPGALQ